MDCNAEREVEAEPVTVDVVLNTVVTDAVNTDDAVAIADIVSSDDCVTAGEPVCRAVLSGLWVIVGELETKVDTVGVGFEETETLFEVESKADELGELVIVSSMVLVRVVDADRDPRLEAESRPLTLTEAVEDFDTMELYDINVDPEGKFDVLDESVASDDCEFWAVLVTDGQELADAVDEDVAEGSGDTETVADLGAEIV